MGKSHIKEVANDVLYYIPAKIIPATVSFLAIAVYTRLLKPDEYGLYILTMTTISITLMTGFAWLESASLRFWEEYKGKKNRNQLLSNVTISLAVLVAVIVTIWYIAILLLDSYLNARLVYLLRVGIVLLGAKAGYNLVISILRARRETFKFALYSSLMTIGGTLLAITFLYFFDFGSEGILFGMAIVSGGISIFELFHLYKKWGINISSFSANLIKKYASYGIPLIGVGFCSLILSSADRYMIAYFLEPIDVGIYSAGYYIANNSISILFGILLPASFPVAIQVFENKGEKETSMFLTRIMSAYLVVLIPAVLGIIILSKDIISLMLPASFQKAFIIIPWVATGVFCLGMTNLILYPFNMKKRTLPVLIFIIVASVLNIIINLILIPLMGILGAALATLISYLTFLFVSWFFSRRILPFSFPWSSFWKSILATGAMCIFLFTWDSIVRIKILDLGFKILIAIIIYLVFLISLKEDNFLKIVDKGKKYFNKFRQREV